MKPGTKVKFTGGYNMFTFSFNGEITGSFQETKYLSNLPEEYVVYTVLLETGSSHYGYVENFELI